jgi:hypothetical protein
VAGGFDVAIRAGDLPDSTLIGEDEPETVAVSGSYQVNNSEAARYYEEDLSDLLPAGRRNGDRF